MSSSASPAPAPGPARALAGEAASPSFPSPTQAAKDPCAPAEQLPGLRERGGQLWKPEAHWCQGSGARGKSFCRGKVLSVLPATACPAGAARQLQGPTRLWGQCGLCPAFAALPDAPLPPDPASVSLGRGRAPALAGTVHTPSASDLLANRRFCPGLLPTRTHWPLAHTHALYLQREGLGQLLVHGVGECPQQSFVLAFLIQSLGDKAQGSRSGSTRPRGNAHARSGPAICTPLLRLQRGLAQDVVGLSLLLVCCSGTRRCWAKTH